MGRMKETNEMFGRLKDDMPKELSGFINFSQITKSDGAIDKKHKELICVPFYPDNDQTLSKLAYNFFRDKKISISHSEKHISSKFKK